jgi:hypothetical protein
MRGVVLLLALACTRPSGKQLTATLIGPSEIQLDWRPGAPETAGHWIEFTTPGADFVKLEVAWPETARFRHADLAGGTRFVYRLVPFFGRASAPVGVRTGTPLPGEVSPGSEGPLEEPSPSGTSQRSLRSPGTLPEAAPTGLTVTLSSPSTAELRWRDGATDEDGFLVELSQGEGPFQICALLPPNTRSFRKVALPAATEVRFRVRAFVQGPPSNLASATTAAGR